MKGTGLILNPEREESVPQNQTAPQVGRTDITNNLAGNNSYTERYPQMKFIREPKYQIHANFRPEVTEIGTRLAEDIREAIWDCQRNRTYTQEAYERNIQRHLLNNPKVTVISHGIIQKIDQYGNPWEEWMDGNSPFSMEGILQQPFLKLPPKQGTADVKYVPLETEKEATSKEDAEKETEKPEEKKSWWERAWDSIKEAASDAWDTITSEEFGEKALKIGGTILGAVALGTAIVLTAGAAGAAVGAAVTYLGGSAALAGAATTATTVGGYALATAVGVDAVNTTVEVGTGTNYIAKGAYKLFGNENRTEEYFLNAYGEGRDILYMAGYSYATFGAYAVQSGFSSQKSAEVGGKYSAFGEMSENDGIRYKQYWDDVTKGLDTNTRVKLNQWEYRPSADLYNKYKSVYNNPKYFNQETGNVNYPGTNNDKNIDGFINGQRTPITLEPGTIIDRYGSSSGKYFSPEGTSYEQRALPPFMEEQPYTKYKVMISLDVDSGKIAPWFEQPGQGTQFLSKYSVDELKKLGYIVEVE